MRSRAAVSILLLFLLSPRATHARQCRYVDTEFQNRVLTQQGCRPRCIARITCTEEDAGPSDAYSVCPAGPDGACPSATDCRLSGTPVRTPEELPLLRSSDGFVESTNIPDQMILPPVRGDQPRCGACMLNYTHHGIPNIAACRAASPSGCPSPEFCSHDGNVTLRPAKGAPALASALTRGNDGTAAKLLLPGLPEKVSPYETLSWEKGTWIGIECEALKCTPQKTKIVVQSKTGIWARKNLFFFLRESAVKTVPSITRALVIENTEPNATEHFEIKFRNDVFKVIRHSFDLNPYVRGKPNIRNSVSALLQLPGATIPLVSSKDLSKAKLSIPWAGDLDGDGKLDLLTQLTHSLGECTRLDFTLHLSGKAKPGEYFDTSIRHGRWSDCGNSK